MEDVVLLGDSVGLEESVWLEINVAFDGDSVVLLVDSVRFDCLSETVLFIDTVLFETIAELV